jgi:hypothetical protein
MGYLIPSVVLNTGQFNRSRCFCCTKAATHPLAAAQHLSHLTQAFLDDAERHGKGIPVAFGDARVTEPRTVAVEARMLKRAFTKLLDE